MDLLGTTYQSPTIATGFGSYIAQPLLRNAVDDRDQPLSENEAIAVIQLCMKALFYRDARSLNKVRLTSRYHLRKYWRSAVSNRKGDRRRHNSLRSTRGTNRMGICWGYSRLWGADAIVKTISYWCENYTRWTWKLIITSECTAWKTRHWWRYNCRCPGKWCWVLSFHV